MQPLLLLALVAFVSASYPIYGKYPVKSTYHVYHGKFPGKCEYDGLYYRDAKSFIYCSNGNSYVQPCAPGSKNSGYEKFSYGGKYSQRDFCDINLNDAGYPAKPGYVEPKPAKPVQKPSYNAVPKPKPKPAPYKPVEVEYPPSNAGYIYASSYVYHGMYPGKCSYDGLYYRDEKSFVFCINGYSYVQRCAPGSRNSGYSSYKAGLTYEPRIFCDVNLVDAGYAADKSQPKPVPKPVYPETKPKPVYPPKPKPAPKPVYPPKEYHVYHGKYPGKCGYSGLYYRDEKSFIYCSNGNAYIQRCAPGSKNSGYAKFSYGAKYSSRDFCDVNLVDEGYAAIKSQIH